MISRLNRFSLYYPLRIVGSYFVALVVATYSLQFDRFTGYRLFLIGVLLVYPHIVRYLAWHYSQDRLKIELRAFLVDSVLVGLAVHLTGFTPLPTFALITVALVNALAVAGFGQMLLSAFAILAAIAVATLFGGLNFDPKNTVALDIAVSVFLFVYFMFFGYSVFNSNALLARSRTELREQKTILEIEKQRSDALLMDLVPVGIAEQLKTATNVEPALFDPVTLLAVDFCGFSRALEQHEPTEALSYLMHCFKAFDAIAGRHGFEKLKTLGDLYLTVAGVSRLDDGKAAVAGVEAALEIRQFLNDLNESRRAAGRFTLETRIAVHSGRAIGGIVKTEKMSYDLWGDAIKTVLQLVEEAPAGQVVISDATRRVAGDGFRSTPAGNVRRGVEPGIVFYNVEKRAA
jgi:class 3 adenylate cyclase